MIFLSLLAVPFLIALGFFFFTKRTITWQEFLAHAAISVVVAGISTAILYWSNTHDVEVWNGHVTSKKRVEVPCSHDYCCGYCESCSTDSKGNTSCHQYCCHTCYYHPFDVDWRYNTTDNGTSEINRVDWQGINEPQRWTKVVIGEPSASLHSYKNYIKASPDSLFSQQGLEEQYKGSLPNYPGNVYDYYRINRLVTVGVSLPNAKQWNQLLMRENDREGAKKEVTMGVVVVKHKPQDYFYAIQQHWLGGKKNDLILVVSVDDTQKIEWAQVMAWTQDKVAQVSVRNAVLDVGTISDPEAVVMAMSKAVDKDFVRKPMKDFEYLASSVTPTSGQWLLATIINVLLSIGLGLFFHFNQFTEDSYSGYRYGGRRRWQ